MSAAVMAAGALVAGGGLAGTAPTASAATAGCGKTPTLNNGTNTIQSGGKTRSYILRIPAGYDNNRPYRLVLGYHWRGGSAVDVDTGQTVQRDVWSYYGLQRLAENSTIFVAPQGLNAGWANTNGEDVTFTDDLLRQLEADLCVDPSLRFALGFSYGGGMSYALACARPTVFRAVAVYAGGLISGCSGGTQPIAYFAAHGLSDNVLGISGGRSLRDRFVRNNGCAAQNPPEPSPGSLRHVTTAYSGCAAGKPVVWAAFDEGHISAPQDGARGDSGTRTWLPGETWRFFAQFSGIQPPTSTTTTTNTSTTTTTTTTTTTPPPGASCRVNVAVNAWNNGLTTAVTVVNTSTATVNGWSLEFTLAGGQVITSGWNASYTPTTGRVTAGNVSYNPMIAPNASVSIGYQATHTGNAAAPTDFVLNGTPCAVS